MLREWLNRLINGKRAYGLELVLTADDEFEYQLIQTNVEKGKLKIIEKEKGKSFKELLANNWDKKLPIFLSVRGKGVLQKKIENKNDRNQEELFQKALPNAKLDDFYFQIASINEGESWLNIIRKELLDNLIKKLIQNQLHVIGIELGFLTLAKLDTLLKNEKLTIGSYQLTMDAGRLINVTEETTSLDTLIDIGDEKIEAHWLPSFAASINFQGYQVQNLGNEFIAQEKDDFFHHRVFTLGIKTALGFFMITLLINFFLFQEYSQQHTLMSDKLAINQVQLDKLRELQDEVKRNELFFNTTDLISTSKNAFYADRLAHSRPKGVHWNELIINPPLKKIVKSEDVEFQIGQIDIKGMANSSSSLNEWIEKLEQLSWISTIDIKDYQQSEKDRLNSFFLQINIK